MIGVTEMIGIDDFGPAETFTVADATTVLNWATQQGIEALSFWALQRDNGGCPGGAGGRQLLRHPAVDLAVLAHLRPLHQRRQAPRSPTPSRTPSKQPQRDTEHQPEHQSQHAARRRRRQRRLRDRRARPRGPAPWAAS